MFPLEGRFAAGFAALKRAASVKAYALSRDGAAVLVGGVFVLIVMLGVGGLMANYAWREAQLVELRAATRAAVSSAGALLAGAGTTKDSDRQIRDRVAAFVSALVPNLAVSRDDVQVSHDADTNTTTIAVRGDFAFDDIVEALWTLVRKGTDGNSTEFEHTVKARLETERYEVAMALDVSHSMTGTIVVNGAPKLPALKAAIKNVLDTLESTGATTPGSVMASIVPYSAAVNVADTCNAHPDTGDCRAARSAGKERYVRMLAGVGDTMDKTLADARDARDSNVGGHWVDSFHHYGAGTGLGHLRRQYLPADLLDDRDWNLRLEDVQIDLSSQVPSMGSWTVDHEDFWNGCTMARWGAYWDVDARPPGWVQDDVDNWPATQEVPAWSRGGSPLAAHTPLHLSDAPPSAGQPSTLFTAFSWPDARITGHADQWLQHGMIEMLHPGHAATRRAIGDNDWSRPGNGGSVFCPRVAITPLTDDLALLRTVVDGLEATDRYRAGNGFVGATYLNIGVAWGLRTLSPLWQGVWNVQDVRAVPRPAVPCAPGEVGADCDPLLRKSILLVTDGFSWIGDTAGSRLLNPVLDPARNPRYATESACQNIGLDSYHAAGTTSTPADFNARFRTPLHSADLVDASGQLNALGLESFVDAFLGVAGAWPNTSTRRQSMLNALASGTSGVPATPWQMFRGLDADMTDVLVDANNEFGFDGRPTLAGRRCRPTSTFGPYGRAGDLVYVGDVGPDASTPPVPIAGVAPFEVASLPESIVGNGLPRTFNRPATRRALSSRIDNWLLAACRIAGERGVRMHVVFIGNATYLQRGIQLLEDCVDSAGGDPDAEDVYITPTPAELDAALQEIFTIRRNLRFLD